MRRIRVGLSRGALLVGLFSAGALVVSPGATAHETGQQHVHFQKPNRSTSATTPAVKFRSVSNAQQDDQAVAAEAATPQPVLTKKPATVNPLRSQQSAAETQRTKVQSDQRVAKAAFTEPAVAEAAPAERRAAARQTRLPSYVEQASPTQRVASRPRTIGTNQGRFTPPESLDNYVEQANFLGHSHDPSCAYLEPGCGICEPTCGCGEPSCGICEPGCGIVEPGCGICEPTCGCDEPSCGICEPGCGIVEPGCGIMEPGCGIAEPDCGCDIGCGSCVDGPDYWCFPVCLPRLKELRIWGGVHGFKGPRDAPALGGSGDGNFGFQEGINAAGRAPIVRHFFPELSYQLGFQGVQSQLAGLSNGSAADRSQLFVTTGLFRRVKSGLQFGAVWDYMDDDFIADMSLQQIRYEISLKSPRGREIGFWGANHLNSDSILIPGNNLPTTFQTVDQYVGFIRWNYKHGGSLRIWGGGTNDAEGIFGGEFWYPASDRLSVQSVFNYLITDAAKGTAGAQEESWNIGINLYWHWDRRARKNCNSPFQPLFSVADNGWMFVDQQK